MKLVHLSDLHIGKRVNDFSMIEDQEYILLRVLEVIDKEKADCVIIAGDIYDKSMPPSEAITLFDDFLYRLSKRNLNTFVLSGNHDSPQRLAFGSRLMDKSGVYMSPVYDGDTKAIRLDDEYGIVSVFMLPFIKPVNARKYFPDKNIVTYSDAVAAALENIKLNSDGRNVLIAHQFVTGAKRSESEDITVGGLDNVESSLFEKFDYVALGHIHKPQSVSRETLRYCGTPLKYSFSEAKDTKSVTVIEMGEKGNVDIRTLPLNPKRDMREIKGSYSEVTYKKNYENTRTDDYLRIILTDEENIPDAINKLRIIYPNIMKLEYDNKRTSMNSRGEITGDIKEKSPIELFKNLYEKQNNRPVSEEQEEFLKTLMEKIWEDDN